MTENAGDLALIRRPPSRRLQFRERDLLPADCYVFGPDSDRFMLFVEPAAVREMRTGTRLAAPREAFALLIGRSFEDREGPYTVVSHAVFAERLQAGRGHVRLTPEEMAALKQRAERSHPTEDTVGWSHSHSGVSDYSGEDRHEQQTWPGACHVGILVFMNGQPWARAYRGPDAQPLHAAQPEPIDQEAETQGLFRRAWDDEAKGRDAGLPVPGHRTSVLRWPRSGPAFVAAAAALLALSFFGARLDDHLAGIGRRLDEIRARMSPGPPSQTVMWECGVRPGTPSLQVSCTGPAGSGITGWSWDFGDGEGASTRTPAHAYAHSGRYHITLTLLAPAGSVDMGAEDLTVFSTSADGGARYRGSDCCNGTLDVA